MATTLEDLTTLAVSFRDERNWKQFHTPKDMALSLVLEAAELLELTQWKNDPELEAHLKANHQHLGEELSDVLYWVLVIANDLGVDLASAFPAKMNKNAQKYPVQKVFGKAVKPEKGQ
jgi:dCTP diphosphatase